YELKNIDLTINGKITDYQLNGGLAFQGQNIPKGSATLNGKGNLTQVTLSSLLVSALKGNVDIAGQASWQDKINWDVTVKANKIDASAEFPQYPLVLNGGLTTTGSWISDIWNIAVKEMALVGNIKKAKINVHGNINGNSQGVWNIHDLDAV